MVVHQAKFAFVTLYTCVRFVLTIQLFWSIQVVGSLEYSYHVGLWIGIMVNDMTDGTLARTLRVSTHFGRCLDGGIDKLIMVVVAGLLWCYRELPWWIMGSAVAVAMLALYQATMYARENGEMPKPRMLGKCATGAWSLLVIPFLAGEPLLGAQLFIVPAATTAAAIADYWRTYTWRWWANS